MEEKRYDGEHILTDKASLGEIFKAMANQGNKMVALHNPGSVVTHSDGKQYVVQADGSWRRLRDGD